MEIENFVGSDFSGVISNVQNSEVMFRGDLDLLTRQILF